MAKVYNFLVKSKLSTAKKSKTAAFSRVFTQNNSIIFLGKSKLNFWTKNMIFRTVWTCLFSNVNIWLIYHLFFGEKKADWELGSYNWKTPFISLILRKSARPSSVITTHLCAWKSATAWKPFFVLFQLWHRKGVVVLKGLLEAYNNIMSYELPQIHKG